MNKLNLTILFKPNMGQTSSSQHPEIDTARYLNRRPELRETDVLDIKTMFDTLVPINGYVDINDLEMTFTNSFELQMIKERCGAKTKLNFDEFFDVISGVILERHQNFKNVDCEAQEKNVQCFCSLSEDTGRSNKKQKLATSH